MDRFGCQNSEMVYFKDEYYNMVILRISCLLVCTDKSWWYDCYRSQHNPQVLFMETIWLWIIYKFYPWEILNVASIFFFFFVSFLISVLCNQITRVGSELVYHRLPWREPDAPYLLEVLYEDGDMVIFLFWFTMSIIACFLQVWYFWILDLCI